MKYLIFFVLALSAFHLPAQTAKVIQLSTEDAKEAAILQAEADEIKAKQEALRARIVKKYLQPGPCPKGMIYCSTTDSRYLAGWESGQFEFSDDFKFIVPNRWSSGISVPPCFKYGYYATEGQP